VAGPSDADQRGMPPTARAGRFHDERHGGTTSPGTGVVAVSEAPEVDPIVAFMANDAAMVTSILTTHVSDRSGRCRVCATGAQRGNQKWPCRLHSYAAMAWEILPDNKNLKQAKRSRSAKRAKRAATDRPPAE
jgi:hypothetical protein